MMTSQARVTESDDVDETQQSVVPPIIERKLLLAFGNSIVVEETSLFDMFHVISGDIVLTRAEFIWYLENMEERGRIVSSYVDGVRSWSRI